MPFTLHSVAFYTAFSIKTHCI